MVDSNNIKGKERNKQELLNNINKQLLLGSIIKTFSFPASKIEIYEDFKKIAQRDYGKRGFSTLIFKLIQSYTLKHRAGNENLKIESFFDKDDAESPHFVLCHYVHGVDQAGRVFCGFCKPHEAVVLGGVTGRWINGALCFGCRMNKLRKEN